MTPLLVGDLVNLRIWCSDAEQASVNTIWFAVAAVGASPATDLDVAVQFDTFLGPLIKPFISNLATYNGCQVQLYTPPPPPFYAFASVVFSVGGAGVGTGGAIALPRQVCGLGSFQSNRPGPSGRGRIYYPFPPAAADIGNGTPSAAYLAGIGVITNDLAVASGILQGGRSATVVRIIRHGKNKSGVFITPNSPVTANSVSAKWATQRRRGSFGRPNVSPI